MSILSGLRLSLESFNAIDKTYPHWKGLKNPELRHKTKAQLSNEFDRVGVRVSDEVFLKENESDFTAQTLPFGLIPDKAKYRGLTRKSKDLNLIPVFYLNEGPSR